MKLYLLQKVIKYKYLYNLVSKGKQTFSVYFLELNNKNVEFFKKEKTFNKVSLPINFLKILISRYSTFYYQWISLFKGSLTLGYSFDYYNKLPIIKKLLGLNKDLLIFGAFIENKFFSLQSLKWLVHFAGINVLTINSWRIKPLITFYTFIKNFLVKNFFLSFSFLILILKLHYGNINTIN